MLQFKVLSLISKTFNHFVIPTLFYLIVIYLLVIKFQINQLVLNFEQVGAAQRWVGWWIKPFLGCLFSFQHSDR